MTTQGVITSDLTEAQRRRVRALACAVALLPHASTSYQVHVARWLHSGVWAS